MPTSDSGTPAGPMTVRFWGVRGSIACPGTNTARYGGNTPCVEIRCGKQVLIFDAGTGIRPLGNQLLGDAACANFNVFLSHCHIDHVVGLPFFAPLYSSQCAVRLWAGNLKPDSCVEDAIRKLMSLPLFPIEIDAFQARVEFHDFLAGETLSPCSGVTLHTAQLNHPGGATGYRVEYGSRSVAYLTDIECGDGPIDPAVLALARGAALVILDTTYTDEELPAHVGWGHSSWQQGVRLAEAAGARQLCLFHHDPEHDDAFMDAITKEAAIARPGTIAAIEGHVIEI